MDPATTISEKPQATRLVGVDEALSALFSPAVRPSPDWLQRQASKGKVAAVRVGRRYAFDLDRLRSDLSDNFKNSPT